MGKELEFALFHSNIADAGDGVNSGGGDYVYILPDAEQEWQIHVKLWNRLGFVELGNVVLLNDFRNVLCLRENEWRGTYSFC